MNRLNLSAFCTDPQETLRHVTFLLVEANVCLSPLLTGSLSFGNTVLSIKQPIISLWYCWFRFLNSEIPIAFCYGENCFGIQCASVINPCSTVATLLTLILSLHANTHNYILPVTRVSASTIAIAALLTEFAGLLRALRSPRVGV